MDPAKKSAESIDSRVAVRVALGVALGYATRVPRRSWNIKTFEVLLSSKSRDMASLSHQSRDFLKSMN